MNLNEFIEKAVETMGGVYEPIEYGLCSVLLPDEYKDYFQGKTELLLAFDYDVAKENPESEFVTYGSFVFDTIFQIARKSSTVTNRFAIVDRISLSNSLEKIKKHLNVESGVEIIEETPGMGLWALYNFVIEYVSDEKMEETHEVWVNLTTGELDDFILNKNIFYSEKNNYPELSCFNPIDMKSSYDIAYNEVEDYASKAELNDSNKEKLQIEVNRITNYYDELVLENEKLKLKKNITKERVEDLSEKSKALYLEKDKQIHEIEEKYSIKTSISLDNAIIYYVPMIKILCSISYRRTSTKHVFYYDLVFKRVINGGLVDSSEEVALSIK